MQDARGESVDLAGIQSNVRMICGKQDPIVTRDCSVALLDYISSEDVTVLDVSDGHMGLLGGSQATAHSWRQIADWLIEHDGGAQP